MAAPADPRELLKDLRETAREAARGGDAGREAADRRPELRARLARLSWSEDLATAVAEHLTHVGARLTLIEGDPHAGAAAAGEVLHLRGDLSWLPLAFPEGELEETILALQAELDSVGGAVAALPASPAGEAHREAKARLTLLKRGRLVQAAERLEEDRESSVRPLWTAYLEARELCVREGAGRRTGERLRKLLVRRIEALPPAEAAEELRRCAAEYEDMSLDLLSLQADLPPLAAAEALDDGRREMAWLRVLLRDARRRPEFATPEQAAARKALARCDARLRKVARRLSRETQDLRLQARLEGIFGRRFVAFFENLILWLILAVLAVLLVEAMVPRGLAPAWGEWFFRELSPERFERARRWKPFLHVLMWIDTGICVVFLTEFFVKLSLVRGKLSWFLRHLLVDLVPSIPYGLLTTHGLDALRALRLGRFLRFSRLLRFMRAARPVVRFVRFFGFLQRALDRTVRLHGNLLNRNIVLFESADLEEDDSDLAGLRRGIRQTRVLARRAWRRLARGLPPEQAGELLARFVASLPGAADLDGLVAAPATGRTAGASLRAEELVRRLTEMDPGTVEAEIGEAGARRLASSLRRLDVPVLRNFPLLRQMIPAARRGEPLERVAAAARSLGRRLERLLGRIHWVSDLSGVISGPQFLDRLGDAMVKATARPARRLLIFGFGFLLLKGFVQLLDWRALEGIADWLGRTLGTPFLILGAACLAVLAVGTWFRRIAGEATDFYSRTAEAQYINLLKSAKLANAPEDLQFLWERVLRPEQLLTEDRGDDDPLLLLRLFEERRLVPGATGRDERILQLYHDYLDGALFHITDTKTSSQLLGNLALENIRSERLGTSREERRRLATLDLDRDRGSLKGPHLWFRSISHSVAQWTAKLILEYNRHAIPLADLRDYPESVVEAHARWLDARIRGDRTRADEEAEASGFVTTAFCALDFLTAEPERDLAIAGRFGERTVEALRADRMAMIRTIFGTYPFHRLPRADRTLNPFELYARHLSGGRVLLTPLYLAGALFRVLRWIYRRIRATIREVLGSERIEGEGRANWASYDVAVRKIHRMRKPLYMECARFRALFDPEYLGLVLVPEEESGVEGRTWREDLDRIGARDEEWDSFAALREEREEALRDFAALVAGLGGPREVARRLCRHPDEGAWRETYRAVATAYAIDYRSVRSLDVLERRAQEIMADVIARRGRLPGAGTLRRASWLLLPWRDLQGSFLRFLARFGAPPGAGPRERRWLWRAVRSDYRGFRRLLMLGAALDPGTSPREAARAVLCRVADHAETWSEQMVTLRTVQSLSVLDVRNYRRQVWALGSYGNE